MKKNSWFMVLALVVLLCATIGMAACSFGSGNSSGSNDRNSNNNGDTPPTTELTQLPSPKNLQLESEMLEWDEVHNAISYLVSIDGDEVPVSNNEYSLTPFTQEGKTYQFKVKAIGDGEKYSNSDWSNIVEYTVPIMDRHEILNAEGFTVNGNNLYIKVHNETTSFDFRNKIEVSEGSSWLLANDPNGESTIVTKTISLPEPGDKIVYIIVTGNEGYSTYEVTVRRRSIYTVTFVIGDGTTVIQQIEEDDYAEPLDSADIPIRTGYEYIGYDFDFETPITDDVFIALKWSTDITYINENGEAQFITEDITLLSSAENQSLTGWYLLSGTISGDFSLTVSGEAHIILADDCAWTVNTIAVTVGNTIYIYSQSINSRGRLVAKANIGGRNGGNGTDGTIGSSGDGGTPTSPTGKTGGTGSRGESGLAGENAGTIIINSGYVTATNIGGGNGGTGGMGGFGGWGGSGSYNAGGAGGAGGTGGAGGSGGTVIINGGTVRATNIGGGNGGTGGAGGSGGHAGSSTGGVTSVGQAKSFSGAAGGSGGSGAAGGSGGSGGTVIINGGTVRATNIGGGNGGTGGTGGSGDIGGIGYTGRSSSTANTVGGKGGNAGAGGAGGSGGNAGAITINGGDLSSTYTAILNIGGGNGGMGGSGGYSGGDGSNKSAGGSGGSGGKGGNGGAIGTLTINDGTLSNAKIGTGNGGKGGNGGTSSNGGKGGNGGSGGNGGNGGNIVIIGGSISSSTFGGGLGGFTGDMGNGGSSGSGGSNGSYGSLGSTGTAGTNIKVYYYGSKSAWNSKAYQLGNGVLYFYSETEPSDNGNYWHYGQDGTSPLIW